MSAGEPGFVYLASQSPRRGRLLEQIGVRYRLLLPAEGEDAEALEAELPGESPEDYVVRVTRAKLQAARARLARLERVPSGSPGEQVPDGLQGEQVPSGPQGEQESSGPQCGQPVTLPRADPAAPRPPILCADTTVALGDRILGKPRDAADAVATLRLLSGATHRVLTAVAIGVGNIEGSDGPAGGVGGSGSGSGSGSACEHLAVSTSRVRIAPLSAAAIDAYVASGEPFGKAGAYGVQGRFAAWIERIDGSYSGIMGLPLFETARLLRSLGFGGV